MSTAMHTSAMPDPESRIPEPNGARGRNRQAGLTLIEVLVAVTLLALLAGGIFTAFHVGASSWQSTRERLMLDRRIATANSILHATLAAIVPIEAEIPRGVSAGGQRFPFFQGERGSMRFVSSYSITRGIRGGLQITELQVSPSKDGLRILLNQSPYTGPLSAGRLIEGVGQDPLSGRRRLRFRPIRPRPSSRILADQLAQCRFRYLLQPQGRGEPTVWVPEWTETGRYPEAISIDVVPKQEQTRLRPVSITAPVLAKPPRRGASRRRRG